MFKKLMAIFAAWAMATATAYSHTNSIGYVGDGNGGLDFWYGSWHNNTNFNEAEIKIQGTDSNGNTITFSDGNGGTQNYSIDAFDKLTASSPAGLISGVNFFTSDGTQLVAYDPTGATNGGTTQESYVWQGINYSNLVTGDYTFTYIPLGSAESSYPNQSPTADWMPMDNVILSLSITLTTGDLTGDANENGILDVEEVAAGASGGSGPTVVSQGSSTAVTYSASTSDGVQTVARTSTTTMWNNMSDGTIDGLHTMAPVALDPLTGRVDQHTQLNKIAMVNRDVVLSDPYRQDGIEGKQGIFFINAHGTNYSMDNGYDANSQTGGIEYRSSVNPGHVVGIMYNKTRVDLVGTDSESDLDQTQLGIYSHLQIGNNLLKTDVGMINSQYEINRSVGNTWNNQSTTNGTDAYLNTRLYVPYKWGMTPFVGYSFNQHRLDGYTESGDSVTARTVDKSETVDRSVEGGIKMDYTISNWDFEAQLMRTSSDLSKQHFGVEYNFSDSKSVGVTVINSDHKDMSAQTVQFAVDINF